MLKNKYNNITLNKGLTVDYNNNKLKLQEKGYADIQEMIAGQKARIEQLNKCYIETDVVDFYGDIKDDTSENVFFDCAEDKWKQIVNTTEELISEKTKELIEIMKSKKLIDEQTSHIYKINVGKILGYNQINKLCFENRNGKSTAVMKQTEEGRAYQYKIAKEVERHNLRNKIKPKPAKYKINVEAYVDYAQKDIDGLKAFVDCLVRALGNGDRKSYDDSQFWDVEIFKTKASHTHLKNKEFFLIEFIEIDESSISEKSLYTRYIKQRAASLLNS